MSQSNQSPADITRLPYRVQAFFANGVEVYPLPAKKFSPDTVAAISAWLVAQGWNISVASDKGVKALNDRGLTAEDVPAAYSATQRKRDEAEQTRLARQKDRDAESQRVLTETPAGRYVQRHFGGVLGAYNCSALAKYLDGSSNSFEGLLNHNCLDVFKALGVQDLEADALVNLKKLYELEQRVPSQDPAEHAQPSRGADPVLCFGLSAEHQG